MSHTISFGLFSSKIFQQNRWSQCDLMSPTRWLFYLNGISARWTHVVEAVVQGAALPLSFQHCQQDVLQQILLRDSDEGHFLHPLVDELPCPILQYMDNTFIIIHAAGSHICNLKNFLHDFSTKWARHQVPYRHLCSHEG